MPINVSEKFVPVFPHAHYHSYAIQNRKMVDINANLKMRAEDIAAICDKLPADSVMDVGSNLGGFLYYLEQFSGRKKLLGIEGDKRFVEECKKVSEHLGSDVGFLLKTVMAVTPPLDQVYDAMILQNVYHYIYDRESNHESIFRQFASLARSILWYNPMSRKDPVIGEHANSNPTTDWDRYTHRDIFEGAIKAGYLHPIPDKASRFGGMGSIREHWIFVKDEVRPLTPESIPLSAVSGREIPIKSYYEPIHSVRMDETRSYKVFNSSHVHLAEGVVRGVNAGVLDETLCPDLKYIVGDSGEVVGYSQPVGTDFVKARTNTAAAARLNKLLAHQEWRLFSRMLRTDSFTHDIGPHNFVVLPHRDTPMLIDLETFVFDASSRKRLSVYRAEPDANEIASAEANLRNLFPDVSGKIEDRNPIEVLWDLLFRSKFLGSVDYSGILDQN